MTNDLTQVTEFSGVWTAEPADSFLIATPRQIWEMNPADRFWYAGNVYAVTAKDNDAGDMIECINLFNNMPEWFHADYTPKGYLPM